MFPQAGIGTQTIFNANSTANDSSWHTWKRDNRSSTVAIFALAGGGGGGNGVVGAAGAAAGGGGGGSSGQAYITMPSYLLPDILYISVGFGGAQGAAGIRTSVSVVAEPPSDMLRLLTVTPGNAGNSATGGTAGTAGTGGTMVANMNLYSRSGFQQLINGVSGSAGGGTTAGVAMAYPNAGLRTCGGTGGAGVPAAGAGLTGGQIATNSLWPIHALFGGAGGTATVAAQNGYDGSIITPFFSLPGQGGGSTHATATGAGLVAGNGGQGSYGGGGGGGGGGLTGSTQGIGGKGGDGYVVIIQW